MSKILNDCRVNISTTCTHYQTFKWCKSHTGIYGFTVFHCRYAGTISKVAYDHFGIFRIQSCQCDRAFGYETMACSVETITTYFIFFIALIWKSIHKCSWLHCLMESGIKYCYIWHTRHNCLARTDSDQVCRIVKRCKRITLFDCCHNFIIYYYRRSKFFSTVYDTMTNCINFFQITDYTIFFVCQFVQYHLNSHFMVWHILIDNHLFSTCRSMVQTSVDSDSLTETYCQCLFCLCINQLIFQR